MNNDQLLAALVRHLTALLPLATSALLLNLALMVLGLAQSANCHLATLATILPIEANRENLIQRLRRWLPRMPRRQFPLLELASTIPSSTGSSQASRDRAATSPEYPTQLVLKSSARTSDC